MERPVRLFALAVSVSLSVASLFGAVVTKLSDDAFTPLRNAGAARKIVLDRLPIYDDKRSTIELEEFQLWAPDAKVIIHGDHGVVLQKLDPPPMRFFRGSVNGDPGSFAYFSIDAKGEVYGMVVTKDRRLSVRTQHARAGGRAAESGDVFLSTFDDSDTIPMGNQTWACDVEKMAFRHAPEDPPSRAIANGYQVTAQGITGTQSYAIKVDIETDNALFVSAGSNNTTETNYITSLSGAVSTIYNRDLNTNLTQGNVHIYTTTPDGWTAKNSGQGLDELGKHYNNPTSPRTSSSVVFLSGKNIPGGVAWTSVAGADDSTFSGACLDATTPPCYAGPYAWCGGIDVGAVPNPNATTGTVLYGMPSSNYWPLVEYAHELGHNLAGTHTHCVAITNAERLAAGVTDGSPATAASDFVDHCYASEGTGCYSGTDYILGSQGVFSGTIMSYCHNVFSLTGVPQSRYTFGQGLEPSHHEVDDYMLRATGPLTGGGRNIVTGVGTFTISAITAPASVLAGSTGNTASITAIAGATYDWSITNGTITSATNSNSITFTAGSAGTTVVRASAYGASGVSPGNRVGVSDAKSVAVTGGCAIAVSPPTGSTINVITGTAFTRTLTSSGGLGTYTYLRTVGPLPTGLLLSTAGVLSGTTAQTGNFPVTITSTDTNACVATVSYTIHVGSCVSGDINGDGTINVADVFFLINYVFSGGPAPAASLPTQQQ